MKILLLFIGFTVLHQVSSAQLPLSRDTVEYLLIHSPAFTIHKDNYFITGTTIGETPTKYNSDAKFQFSFRQRLLNKPIGKSIFFYLTYTQKSFWNIYQSSSPFEETNYNPGLLFVKPCFRNEQFAGVLSMSFEHESNGKDSIDSRSWNFLSVGYAHIFSRSFTAGLKLWIPFALSENPDLMEYIGYGELQAQWTIKENRLYFDFLARKGASWDGKGSLQTSLSYRPLRNRTVSLMLQWWQGYAESLIDYQERRSMLRFGLMIKPSYLRFY
jgi:phospholipase A1